MLRKPVPKTQKAKRAIKEREPKLVENVKSSLVLKGSKSSDVISKALRDVHMLKKPDSKMFIRKNATRPFEDQTSVEFLARTNDTSLFAFGSHTKKRPHNLVMGRLFDFQILDMIEFGLDPATFKSMQEFSSGRQGVVRVGSKPCFVFQGEEFEKNEDFQVMKSLFLDYFRGEVLDQLNLAGVDRVIVLTAMEDKIFFRHYSIAFKRSGTKLPMVELEEVGPTLDLTFRRRKSAAADVQKASMRQPKTAPEKPKKVKNIEEGQYGDKVGRVHKGKQDFTKIALSKRKALKRPKEDAGAAAPPADDGLAAPSQLKRVKPTPKKAVAASSE